MLNFLPSQGVIEMRFSYFLLATSIMVLSAGCDRAQQAALALSNQKQETVAEKVAPIPIQVENKSKPLSHPEPVRVVAPVNASDHKPSPPAVVQDEAVEWILLADERMKNSVAVIQEQAGLSASQQQLVSAMAIEINSCAQDRATRKASGKSLDIKRAVFDWAEAQCAKHIVNDALLKSGPARAKELSRVASILNPEWGMEIVTR